MTHHTITRPGSRPINEDTVAALEQDGNACFVVADGLGGHGKGEIASQKLVEVFAQAFALGAEDSEAFLTSAFDVAQEEILAEQKRQNAGFEMKTTAVALSMMQGRCQWAWVGDSRLYVFRKNKVKTRTIDHSVPQMLALSGEIKEKQIRHHPDRNRLLRVLGVAWDSPRYELSDEVDLADCQAFLLCTDGFWELIDEKRMGALLKKSGDAKAWLEAMTLEVEKNGAEQDMDNYSAVAVIC
jgi:serine/threonine protein phosphatase PrpC